MDQWVRTGISDARGQLAALGHGRPGDRYQLTCRYIGQQARSGCRQVLFFVDELPVARVGFATCYGWWIRCTADVDMRGWRFCPVRWWQP